MSHLSFLRARASSLLPVHESAGNPEGLIAFGAVGADQIAPEDDVVIVIAPQSMVGASVYEPLAEMVHAGDGGCRPAADLPLPAYVYAARTRSHMKMHATRACMPEGGARARQVPRWLLAASSSPAFGPVPSPPLTPLPPPFPALYPRGTSPVQPMGGQWF